METITYEEKLEVVEEAYPMWGLGNVYRFSKWSNFISFEEWIDKLYNEIKL